MLLKLDVREKKLIELINAANSGYNFTIKTENLDLGDIIICDDDETELLLIERKSLADLAASIKDGRYSEQSYRLNSYSLHNHNIIYLIEGNLSMFGVNYHSNYNRNQRINKKSLQSSILTLLYYKGFSVLRTMSIEETSELLLQMCDKIGREKTKKTAFYSLPSRNRNNNNGENNNNSENTVQSTNETNIGTGKITNLDLVIDSKPVEKRYSEVVKKVKKENITLDNIGEIMLSQIPGVSNAGAISIMKKYCSIDNLIDCLRENPKCLDDIKIKTTNGGERRISKTSVQNIISYLLQREENTIQINT